MGDRGLDQSLKDLEHGVAGAFGLIVHVGFNAHLAFRSNGQHGIIHELHLGPAFSFGEDHISRLQSIFDFRSQGRQFPLLPNLHRAFHLQEAAHHLCPGAVRCGQGPDDNQEDKKEDPHVLPLVLKQAAVRRFAPYFFG